MSAHSAGLRQAFILSPNNLFAINSFEPPHGEVTPSYSLKMRDECVIHDGATNGSDKRSSLRRSFFCHDKSKTGRDLCNETHHCWSAFSADAVFCNEACGLGHTIC